MTNNISRRSLLGGFISGALVGVSNSLLRILPKWPSAPRALLFARNHSFPPNPSVVAREFVRANSPSLFSFYSVFFPQFIEKYRYDAPTVIRAAAEHEEHNSKLNRHRLNALPAVAATHVLPICNSDDQRENLCTVIKEALLNPDREIREIVLQNLICGTTPHFDTIRFLTYNDDVLTAIDQIISETAEDPLLVSPLCIATDLLMNYYSLLKNRQNTHHHLSQVERRIDRLLTAEEPHFVYAKRLIQSHPGLDSGSRSRFFLPPQRTEALLGSVKLYQQNNTKRWLTESALVQTRSLFVVYQVANGKLSSTEAMNREKAQRALPKALAFQKYHISEQVFPRDLKNLNLRLPQEENEFKEFLDKELWELIDNTEFTEHKPSRQEEELSRCVPFSEYGSRNILEMLALKYGETRREFLRELVSESFEGIFYGGSAGVGLVSLWRQIFGSSPDVPREEADMAKKEEFRDDVAAAQKAADKELGDSLDEQEEELGPLDLDDLFDDNA